MSGNSDQGDQSIFRTPKTAFYMQSVNIIDTHEKTLLRLSCYVR